MGEEDYYPILILVGASHSGKTYYAEMRLTENKRMIRVNKDDLREMFSLGKYDPLTEEIIKNSQIEIIRKALRADYEVIIDNTHLKQRDLYEYVSLFGGNCGVLFFDSAECLDRLYNTKRISVEVLEKQIEMLEKNFPKEKFPRGKIMSIYEVLFGDKNE